ncbi:nicotinate-nucleotide--dimethylbenzimidazole phosphoribosyltransferase [Pedobacter flavus]|uniref:Nicotinate-nucleotide--dimethylbenzimidazole phosphoribosyltransferase n=1 Tax=Pedobacter flavus TaxID=3113906 RepID=A0ABU7H2B0_9SPHI|nr:nicotinate-nucleotide--dimethylbenzimidazole phosphoribosyltransferase [Pedobacter sp. VNH31]MEE1885442.1 nicotinate-nucleotide--dimethylbenzimidazole phosphoribosyltransferase [Pedobacter sp. VNH31]
MILKSALKQKIDFKTKPLGALGTLEKLAYQIGTIQHTLNPVLKQPTIVVFAADHGIANEGVSAYPPEVTHQMVLNFLNGGAAINVFSNQNNINLIIADAGVNFNFNTTPNLINCKVGFGTKSFLNNKAMTSNELEQCFKYAHQIVEKVNNDGCNIIGFGEMGIGNTSTATMLMSYLCDFPIESCIGRGTGLNDNQLNHKIQILNQAKRFHGHLSDPMEILQTFGGFEVAQMCGAMLAAFEKNMLIMVDGFIASTALLVASKLKADIINNAIFCHQSDEAGHHLLLQHFNATPLIQLNLRVGEGTGCAIAYPIIQSAVNFLNEMASFESAEVSNKEI